MRLFTIIASFIFLANLSAAVPLNLDDGIMAHGYDVVAYIKQEAAVKGSKDHQATHNGATYYFSSAENKSVFTENPAMYVPAYGGWCAYAMKDGEKVDVNPKTFSIIDGKVYLFYNGFWGNTLKKWNKEGVDTLKPQADAEWATNKLVSYAELHIFAL